MRKTIQEYTTKAAVALLLTAGLIASANAIPVTINMTADNIIADGGLCSDASCAGLTGWAGLVSGSLSNLSNWHKSDSLTIDLSDGTYYFTWDIFNNLPASSGNPAGLLAEILWDGNTNYSSSAWEIYDVSTGATIENATEYGLNGGSNIWKRVNGGPVAGISTNSNWIYTSNNFSRADESAWVRTSITIHSVPEPGVLALITVGLLGLTFMRRKRNA